MSRPLIRVLLVEDNKGDARLLMEMLKEPDSTKFELTHVESVTGAINHLVASETDIILLDLGLPDASGLDAVRQVHAMAPNVPLVVLTGLDDEGVAMPALQEGAQDYLIKGQISTHALLRGLRYAIERQRMQVETDQVRKLELQLKDEFLSHVSHELRSPLTAIYQFATILSDGLAGDISLEQRDCLQVILRNVAQLQAMIVDLLEVTRAQEGKLSIDLQGASVFDAIAYAVRTLQGAAKDKNLTLSFDPPPQLPLVAYADPTRIRQILLILLDNAVKFSAAGSTVTVEARLSPEDPHFILFEVTDSGCGINPDMIERIFERLYQVTDRTQAGRRGLGLGLYICKELVTRQGGSIWVSSSPRGSVFSFTLPVFSLAQLLSPLLKNGVWPASSVALVTVEIRSPDGWLSKETREEWSRDSRSLLLRCLLPDLDVLLPKMGSTSAAGFFQVVAFADEKGLAVLTTRIREQFQRVKHCKESSLTFSAVHKLVEPTPVGSQRSPEEIAGQMAVGIEDLIKSVSLGRTAQL